MRRKAYISHVDPVTGATAAIPPGTAEQINLCTLVHKPLHLLLILA